MTRERICISLLMDAVPSFANSCLVFLSIRGNIDQLIDIAQAIGKAGTNAINRILMLETFDVDSRNDYGLDRISSLVNFCFDLKF